MRIQKSYYQGTHGETKNRKPSPEYAAWQGMKYRCHNPHHKKFADYGGRGIVVCSAWVTNFSQFLRDMGRKPNDQYSLDRIDVNKGYEPNNCRWATRSEQQKNRRAIPHQSEVEILRAKVSKYEAKYGPLV